MIHRRKFGPDALCGKTVPAADLTVDDDAVDCPKCKEIIHQISESETKTKSINRIVLKKGEDP